MFVAFGHKRTAITTTTAKKATTTTKATTPTRAIITITSKTNIEITITLFYTYVLSANTNT